MFRASQIATATRSPTAASAARAEVAAPKDAAATRTTIDELRRPDMANVPCPDQRDRRVGLTRTRLGGGWWVVGSGWWVVGGWPRRQAESRRPSVCLQADGTDCISTSFPFSIATLSGWMWSALALFASYINLSARSRSS